MSEEREGVLRSAIRDVPDFPKPGIVFKDITPLLGDAKTFRLAIDALADLSADLRVDQIVAIESRGFIFGGALAQRIGAGFVPVRKPGKLPWRRLSRAYDLEYGTDAVEMHQDALHAGANALVVDDVIATGGTARATCKLVKRLGGELVGAAFLIELTFLDGGAKLAPIPTIALVRY